MTGAGVRVKVCGVTTDDDARMAVDLGAWAIGVNFVPASPRHVTRERACRIVEAVGGAAEVVAVVADLDGDTLRELVRETGVDWVQLHGDEAPALVAQLLPRAFKAVRVGSRADAARIDDFPGVRVLADARAEGVLGGSGRTFDWTLVEPFARRRELILAGGLTGENVARAIDAARPFAVDVASGVEDAPGRKSAASLRAFMGAVAAAAQ